MEITSPIKVSKDIFLKQIDSKIELINQQLHYATKLHPSFVQTEQIPNYSDDEVVTPTDKYEQLPEINGFVQQDYVLPQKNEQVQEVDWEKEFERKVQYPFSEFKHDEAHRNWLEFEKSCPHSESYKIREETQELIQEFSWMTSVLGQMDDHDGYEMVIDDKQKTLKMYIKRDRETGTILVKFEVERVPIPMFNLCTLIYETDLYPMWFPFVQRSETVHQFAKARKLAWQEFKCYFPLSNRESNMYGLGIDRLEENGTCLVIAKSLDTNHETKEENTHFLHVPLKPKRQRNHVHVILHFYGHEFKPISKTEVTMRSVFQMDPQVPHIPQGLINWFTQHFTKFLFEKMLKFGANLESSKYGELVEKKKETEEFYNWIEGEIKKYEEQNGFE